MSSAKICVPVENTQAEFHKLLFSLSGKSKTYFYIKIGYKYIHEHNFFSEKRPLIGMC